MFSTFPRTAGHGAVLTICIVATILAGSARAETGIASTYTDRVTSTGAHWRDGMNAAHRTLPIGAIVKVTNLRNGRSVIVRIGDRGPFKRGRIIDMAPKGAAVIGLVDDLARVDVECLGLC